MDDLKFKSDKAWAKKSDKELREYVRKGVKEINKRLRQLNEDDMVGSMVSDLMGEKGTTSKGLIIGTSKGVSHSALQYQARIVRNILKADVSSSWAELEEEAKFEHARLSYNSKPGRKQMDKETYRQYVELLGAFKDHTTSMSSDEIRNYVVYSQSLGVDDMIGEILSKYKDGFNGTDRQRRDAIMREINDVYSNRIAEENDEDAWSR